MKDIIKIYQEFERMMEEDRIYEDTTIDFCGICRELKVSPGDLDEVLLRELGFTGDALLAEYRRKM